VEIREFIISTHEGGHLSENGEEEIAENMGNIVTYLPSLKIQLNLEQTTITKTAKEAIQIGTV